MLRYRYVNAEVLGEIFVPVTLSAKSLTCKCTGHELTSLKTLSPLKRKYHEQMKHFIRGVNIRVLTLTVRIKNYDILCILVCHLTSCLLLRSFMD